MNTVDLSEVLPLMAPASPSAPSAGGHPPVGEMLTATELAVRLKTTVRTIENWKRRRVLLSIKVDKVVLFYWPSVVARLLEKYQEREEAGARIQKSEDRRQGAEVKGQKTEVSGTSSGVRQPSPGASRLPLPSDGRGRKTESTPHPGPLPGRGGEGRIANEVRHDRRD